jgi:acyl-CoA thioester hydrolase
VSRTYTHDVEVQYRDLDTRRHVNHVVYASYLETAKERFFADVLGTRLVDAPTVVRRLELDYRAPIDADTTVTATLGPVSTGRTSMETTYELAADGDVLATGRTVSVHLGDGGTPEPLPAAWRRALDPYAPEDGDGDGDGDGFDGRDGPDTDGTDR